MKDTTLILTERRHPAPTPPVNILIQETITVWLTKELTK